MKRMLIVGLVIALSTVATAGGNPCVRGYIDFDPPNHVHEYIPAPYETFNAYVCFDCLDMGLTTVSFMLSDPAVTCPGVFAPPSFTNLLPGDLAIGTWNGGITLASTECVGMDDYVCVGYLQLFYLGGACCIELLPHPDYPGWIVDCQDPGQVDYYCVLSHGAVGGALPETCPPGDVPCACPCGSAVEDASWGEIKALFR